MHYSKKIELNLFKSIECVNFLLFALDVVKKTVWLKRKNFKMENLMFIGLTYSI
jgi:hypothetical protein